MPGRLSPVISPSPLLGKLTEKCLRTGSEDRTRADGIDSNTGVAHFFSQTGRDQNIGGFGSRIIRHSSRWLKTARQPTFNGKSSAVDPAEQRWPHESRTFRELLPPGELKRNKGKYL